MQVPPAHASLNGVTARSGVRVRTDALGLAKLGASVYILRVLNVSKVMKYAGVPSSGVVEPSRSEGRYPPSFVIV